MIIPHQLIICSVKKNIFQLLLVVPVELFRWIIILLAGIASSWFIAVNLKAYTQSSDLMMLIVGAMVLQFALALFIKMFFFP